MRPTRLLPFVLASFALAAQVPPNQRAVVVISIDGLPAYSFDDPKLPTPTLRRLAREGAIAKAMRPVNPTVTWPCHTSMVTGVTPAVHGVLFNGMLVRQGPSAPPKVEPWRDKSEMVHATTVYDLAYRAGLTTAQVDWVAITNPGTITWAFPERPNVKGAIEREMIAAGLVREADLASFNQSSPAWRDEIWTRAGVHLIRRHKPNLLLFHLLDLDTIHHRYGPRTPAAYAAIAFADDRVRDLVEALRSAGLEGRATVLIVSDHGFKTVRRNAHPKVLLARQGIPAPEVAVIPEGGTAMIYVNNPANRDRLVPRLKAIFGGMEGVDRVLDAADFAALGMPLPKDYDQMADLVLAAKDGYAFDGADKGEPVTDVAEGGSHGYLNTDPEMNAVFVAWGYGVSPGTKLDVINNLDLAPTIASLLGQKMGNGKGRAIPFGSPR